MVRALGEAEESGYAEAQSASSEGGVYHVYSRLGRGKRVFDQEIEVAAFVEQLRDLVQQSGPRAGWGHGGKMKLNSGITCLAPFQQEA